MRSRVIADCAALLPLARSACAAMDEGDETEVLRLFCGESQKQTLRRLGRLIDDLSLCRTAADLPGPEPEVVESWRVKYCNWRREKWDAVQAEKSSFEACKHCSEREREKFYRETAG